MALTNNGTLLGGDALTDAIAAGFSNPAVTTFTDYENVRNKVFNVAKSTVENATPSVTYEAIRAACATEQGTDAADFDATNAVTHYGTVNKIELISDPEYGATAPVYQCTMVAYVKVA